MIDEPHESFPAHDLPSQPAVFAPDYAPEEIAEIAAKLRSNAGLPKHPTGRHRERRRRRDEASGADAPNCREEERQSREENDGQEVAV